MVVALLSLLAVRPNGARSVHRQRRRDPDVVDERVVGEAHAFGRGMGSEATTVHEVDDVDASHEHEMIGEQTTMTTPPHGLTAHHGRRLACGEGQ